MGGPIGEWMTKRFNFFVRSFTLLVYGDKRKLTPAIHANYILPFQNPYERKGMWVFPRQIINSSKWLASLHDNIGILKNKKILIAWGMNDIAFREKELKHWMRLFPDATTVRYAGAGHYLAEEKPEELTAEIKRLLSGNRE
jgi:haloalkane dehalogenase